MKEKILRKLKNDLRKWPKMRSMAENNPLILAENFSDYNNLRLILGNERFIKTVNILLDSLE